VPGENIYFQRYNGKSLVNIDSIVVSSAEKVFKGNKTLDPGMYAFLLNKALLANFFISDRSSQCFTISLDAQNPAQTLIFTGSPENQAFVDYLRFLGANQQKQDEIKQRGNQLQKQFPVSMLALFIQTMKEPNVPEPTTPVTDLIEYKYNYLANHYFDNVDFSDKRLLNTPLLEQKLDFYFKQMIPPLPDSIIERVDETLVKAKTNSEVYNWTVRYLYNLYREASIEGNTEVYNFIGENYILTEPNHWNDKPFVDKVRNRVAKAKLNPVGKKATNLILQTPEGKKVDLYTIKANYTVLFFYNPECEACKPVSAALSEFSKQYRSKGVEVFAVYMDQKQGVWKAVIATKGQYWINAFDPDNSAKIEDKYDLYALPMIYILDKNKTIIAKDVTVDQLDEYLN
jgi:thiol-disulfide isomerase/thioredoxin